MNTALRIGIGIFVILHGLVHPILAIVPAEQEEGAEQAQPELGGFWKKSWLLGDSPFVKTAIYILSGASALVLLPAGMSFLGFLLPAEWWKPLFIAGAGISALLLIVFWNSWFVVGLIIDAAMLTFAFIQLP